MATKARGSMWAWALSLVLGVGCALAQPVVVNPSFELDTFWEWPGYSQFGAAPDNGPITGWVSTQPTNTGLNPISDGQRPFADNGVIPDSMDVGQAPNPTTGGQVAFIQAGAPVSLSQVISDFDLNASYILEYRENARHHQNSATTVSVSLGGDPLDLVPAHTARSVGGSNPYHTLRSRMFRASDASAMLTFTATSGADNTALLDNVRIIQVTEHPSTPLFQDTFSVEVYDASGNGNGQAYWNINAEIPGTRQSGLVGPLSYLELTDSATGSNWRTQVDNPGRPDATLLASGLSGNRSVWISPDHDFVEAPLGGRQVIQCSLDPAADGYQALIFGTDAPSPSRSAMQSLAENSAGFGFELQNDGLWQFYDGAMMAGQGSVAAHDGFYDVRAELSVSDFASGSPLTVRLFVDDLLAMAYSSASRGFNYIAVEQFGGSDAQLSVSYVDDLLVYNIDQVIPEPASVLLLGLGLAGLRARRRRR